MDVEEIKEEQEHRERWRKMLQPGCLMQIILEDRLVPDISKAQDEEWKKIFLKEAYNLK